MKQLTQNRRMAKLLFLSGIAVFSMLLAVRAPLTVHALDQSKPGEYDPTGKTGSGFVQCGNISTNPCTVEDIFNIFIISTNVLIGMAGIIAIYGILFSAFGLARADGKTEAAAAAKKGLTNSIVGLVLTMLAFAFINLVLHGILGLPPTTDLLSAPANYIGTFVGDQSANPPQNTTNTNPPTNKGP